MQRTILFVHSLCSKPIFQVLDPPPFELVEDKMKQNSLHLMQRFHNTQDVCEEIAHSSSHDADTEVEIVHLGRRVMHDEGESESSSRCMVSSIKSSVQKTSSLTHRLTTPFKFCKKR